MIPAFLDQSALARARERIADIPRYGEGLMGVAPTCLILPVRNRPAPKEERGHALAGTIQYEAAQANKPAAERAKASAERKAKYGPGHEHGLDRYREAFIKGVPKPPKAPRVVDASKRLRRAKIIKRDRAECNHMHEGAPCWNKEGPTRAGGQRYCCAACGKLAKLVDGVITPTGPRPGRAPSPEALAKREGCPHAKWKRDGIRDGVQVMKCIGCGKTRRVAKENLTHADD